MSCVNRAFLLTGKIFTPGFSEDLIIVVPICTYIFAVLNNNTGKYVYKCNNTCVSCIFVWMDEGRVWIGYNEKDCLPRNPQTNIL